MVWRQKTQRSVTTKKWLIDDYQYESEKEKEQQTRKKPDKEEPPKKLTKTDLSEFNKWVNKKETGINRELFQKHFKFQRSGDMLKTLYTINDKKKNNNLVNMINSRSGDLKNEIENISEEEKEIEKPNEIVDIVETLLSLMIKPKQEWD